MDKKGRALFWPLWVPPLVVAAGIAAVSSLPTRVVPRTPWFHADTILHFCEYFFLAYLLRRALTDGASSFWRRAAWIWTILLAGLYAALDEWHQGFIPGRCPALKDWIADLVGVVAAQGLFWRIRRVAGKS